MMQPHIDTKLSSLQQVQEPGMIRIAMTGQTARLFVQPWCNTDTFTLFAVMTFALLLRILFFTGVFGSDEVTYVSMASQITRGEWIIPYYVGADRYGVNLPIAAFMTIFGSHEWSASLWGMLTSVGEVGLVYWLTHSLAGRKAAITAAVLLAVTPLHMHLAGRLMADPPLAFFITLSFALLLMAELRQKTYLYFVAGLSAGFVFWIKEVVLIYILMLGLAALLLRPWRNARLLIITGLAATVAANLVFMYLLTGNALHILKVLSSVATNYYSNGGETVISYPGYYFKYLFLNIQHTGLLGILALGGVAFWLIRCRNLGVADIGVGYVVVWGLGLLFLFSFFIISLSPVIFIAKQTNYMMIFVAPLSMLGGYLIAQMRQTYGYTVLGIAAIIGIVLGAMEQASTQTFTQGKRIKTPPQI
jgi:4-amino-4-deoxy-L-arabinose transferase-like glycosyltransferase